MNKLEAMRYLYAKEPGERRVKDEGGYIWLLNEEGNVFNKRGSDYFGLISGVAYFPLEPEKTNEELVAQIMNMHENSISLHRVFKCLLDIIDKKIEEAK